MLNKLKKSGLMAQSLLNVGHRNTVAADRVIAILSYNSAPVKRLKDDAKEDNRLIDATFGRKTRSIIIMDSNHVVLSAIQEETVVQRYSALMEAQYKKRCGEE